MVLEKGMEKLVIDIYRLSNKLHQYEFKMDEAFFSMFDQDLVSNGDLNAKIDLDKNDSFIGMSVEINGEVELTCDRSLEKFQYPIHEERKVILKYGEEEKEIDHDVNMITRETQQINVGQYLFEFVGLAIPMKKLHPKFSDNEEEFNSLVYSSQSDATETSDQPDPRWQKLNDLKKN